jgi:hypothetical protein
MAQDSDGNPWRKCADDAAKFYTGLSEGQVAADATGSGQTHELALSYLNPATGKAFTDAQLALLRAHVTKLSATTQMVAVTADDDSASYQSGEGGGHEVYILGTDAKWFLLTPGTNGECGGGSGSWPQGGSASAFYLWTDAAATSTVSGNTTSHAKDKATAATLTGVPKSHLLPSKVRLAVYTGGGVSFGWSKATFLLR